ncbi:UNVERIFIED_CONTAM: hypothetical protein FKN15_068938 [Acipenser sinensis]
MLTMQQLLQSIRPGDWFTTVDHKDTYFHSPIKPVHRKYLRFAFQGTTYKFRVLPFGISVVPCAFSKCVEAILAPLRLKGIREVNYMDYWLICVQSPAQADAHTELVTGHIQRLGLTVNHATSQLTASQTASYLEVCLESNVLEQNLLQEVSREMVYINLRSPSLHCVGHKLLLWAHENLQTGWQTSSQREPHFGEMRESRDRSLCLPGIDPLSPVVRHKRRWRLAGDRCLGTPVAEATVICLPTMLPLCLEKIMQDQAKVLLVASYWPRRLWVSALMQLLSGH